MNTIAREGGEGLGIAVVDLDAASERTASSARLPTRPATEEAERIAVYFHTSGSSGLPKPVPVLHRHLSSVMPFAPADDGPCAAFSTTPLFHGGLTDAFRAFNATEPIHFFPLHRLPVTAANVRRAVETAGKDVVYFFTVPYILKLLVEADELAMLASMRIVSTGGAPLSDELGERLVKAGVPLVSRYGSSECGCASSRTRRS